jgi:hydroxymethylbilane synthase
MKRACNESTDRLVLRLGTRSSALAMVQSQAVAEALEHAHRNVKLRVELVRISTRGDKDRRSPLKSFGGTGVFVKELERALMDKRIDFAVHSLKDMPLRQPKGLALAAVTKREDVRDVLVMRTGTRLTTGSVVGTGSPRRRSQLAVRQPTLDFIELRGNVETRLRKVANGYCDATLLAHAGLKRLGWRVPPKGQRLKLPKTKASLRLRLFSLNQMLPAPGQGALGLECRSGDRRTRRLLSALNHSDTFLATTTERTCLASLGGGCDLPLGTCARVDQASGKVTLQAVLATQDGRAKALVKLKGPIEEARQLGRRAGRTLRKSPVSDAMRTGGPGLFLLIPARLR